MIKFGIIGAGWRSEFYLRIAMLVPEIFSVSGIYIRNPEKRINDLISSHSMVPKQKTYLNLPASPGNPT